VSTSIKADLLSAASQPKTSVANTLAERISQELVIALVGPVASGVSTAADYLNDILKHDFGYDVCPIIKPSDIIRSEAHRVGRSPPPQNPYDAYITEMQTIGNLLREQFGANYLAEKVVEKIFKFRKENGGLSENGVHLPGRRAYVIDSLKNTEELNLLRSIYGETLCLIGIFAPDLKREARLTSNGVPTLSVENIMDRDQAEAQAFGQKTRKVFVQSDFFVCNDLKKDELRSKVFRFIDIMFDTSIHTPTRAESAMYEAMSASANSACMSRQVGAAIVSSGGELISVGWNDVPRFGGGLYREDDQSIFVEGNGLVDRDNRCFKWGGSICHNETKRGKILEKIAQKIAGGNVLKREKTAKDIEKLLEGTDIDNLTEFSRSIHAEMEAILSVAREGRNSLTGATIYTSTYPCHNCARHIVASGIVQVVYIEPYLKSLAIDLHHDAITEDINDKSKVVFRQYDGVAPRNYLKLFKPVTERKAAGRLSRGFKKFSYPIFRVPLDAGTDYEAKVIADLVEKEQTPSILSAT
jgi:deoxycytidylate deaminase